MCENGSPKVPSHNVNWVLARSHQARVVPDSNNNLAYDCDDERVQNSLDSCVPTPDVGTHRYPLPLPRYSDWHGFGNQLNNVSGASKSYRSSGVQPIGPRFPYGMTNNKSMGFNRDFETYNINGELSSTSTKTINGSGSMQHYVQGGLTIKPPVENKTLKNDWFQASPAYSGGSYHRLESYSCGKNYGNDRNKTPWSVSNSGLAIASSDLAKSNFADTVFGCEPEKPSSAQRSIAAISKEREVVNEAAKPACRDILRSLLTKKKRLCEEAKKEGKNERYTCGNSSSLSPRECLPLGFGSQPSFQNSGCCSSTTTNTYKKNACEMKWNKNVSSNEECKPSKDEGDNIPMGKGENKRMRDPECWERLGGKVRRVSEVDLLKKECVLRNGKTFCFDF